MHRLIGLGGVSFSGKDAVADFLVADLGWKKHFMSFYMIQAVLAINPLVPVGEQHWQPGTDRQLITRVRSFARGETVTYAELHHLVGYNAAKRNKEVRRLYQVVGTEVGRNLLGENVWVDKIFADVDTWLARSNVVVTSMRFPNELEALLERGGLAVWVHRPGYGPVNGHSSDNTLGPDDFDTILCNDGSLEDLKAESLALADRAPARIVLA